MKQEQHDSKQVASSFGATLRAALGAALFAGLVLGLVDGMIVYRSLGEVLELRGLLVGILIDCLGLGLVALALAAVLHAAFLRERSVRTRLWFFGAVTLTLGLCLGLYTWRSAGLGRFELLFAVGASLAAGLFFGWIFASLGPRVHVALRALAMVLCLLGSWALPTTEAAAHAPLQQLRVNKVLTLVVPELKADDLASLPAMSALAERGATLLNVYGSGRGWQQRFAHFMSAQAFGFGDPRFASGQDREALPFQRRYLPANLEFAAPGALNLRARRRRVLRQLVLFKLSAELAAWFGDDGLAEEAVDWLAQRREAPAWCLVMSRIASEGIASEGIASEGIASESTATPQQAADDLLASLLRSLESAGLSDETLVMVVGLADTRDTSSEQGEVVILANTRLVPHGKRVEQSIGLIDLLPTVADLMGMADLERDGVSFSEAIVGQQRREGFSKEEQ